MPSIWEQLFGIVVIALAMVFGGFLYRRNHGGTTGRTSASRPASQKGSNPQKQSSSKKQSGVKKQSNAKKHSRKKR